jgi:hypothetical protein
MRNILVASATALSGLAAAPATAMPFAPLTDSPSGVTLVAMGCGPGWTRGPYGHCRPMGGYAAPRPAYGYGYHPYAHPYGGRCWWRGGVRVCN